MTETPTPPVSQITITFGGADGMAPALAAGPLSPAQWAIAVQLVTLYAQSSWTQAIAQAQAQGIVRAPASALGHIGRGSIPSRAGRSHG